MYDAFPPVFKVQDTAYCQLLTNRSEQVQKYYNDWTIRFCIRGCRAGDIHLLSANGGLGVNSNGMASRERHICQQNIADSEDIACQSLVQASA